MPSVVVDVVADDGQNTIAGEYVYAMPAPTPGAHPFYDRLAARPDQIYAYALRSQAEIDRYRRRPTRDELPPRYDARMDACLFPIDPHRAGVDGSANEPAAVFLPVVIPAGTSFVLTFDHCLSAGWRYLGSGYIGHYKSFSFRSPSGAVVPAWIQIKHFFNGKGGLLPIGVATYNVEVANSGYAIAPTTVVSEVIWPQIYFDLPPDRWVRTWVGYDHTAAELSVWAADSVQAPRPLLRRVRYAFPTVGVNVFRMQFDTSGDQVPALNPASQIWARNLVVLRGASLADVLSLEGL